MAIERVSVRNLDGVQTVSKIRYEWAVKRVRGQVILDCACGCGFGSFMLSAIPGSRVLGIDNSQHAIDSAQSWFPADNITYIVADAHALPLDDDSIDTVCSLETLEHFSEPSPVLTELLRVLKPDGVFIASMPVVQTTDVNEYHKYDWHSMVDASEFLCGHGLQLKDWLRIMDAGVDYGVFMLEFAP